VRRARASWTLGLLCLAISIASRNSPAASADSTLEADKDGRIRVQFVPYQQSVLASELSAKIISLPFREGDAFRAGQALVGFDCDFFRAQLNKAEASSEAAVQTLKVDRRLAQLNSIGTLDVDVAAAKLREAQAEVGAMQVTVSKCTLAAPFSGRIAKLDAQPYEYVAPGKPLLEILATNRLELQMIVPSKWLAWLRIGGPFSVRVDELDRDYTGRIVRLGARIDPLSRTISLAGEIEGHHPELLAGMSGAAMFKVGK